MPVVVGVDSSTTACKVEVRDADSGEVVGAGRAPHRTTLPPKSEQDPADWQLAFDSACEAAGVASFRPAALSIAAQQHGLVVLDAAGHVLRPAKLWNDTESAADAAWLLDRLSAAEFAAACGSVPVAAFTLTKLSWLHRSEPAVFAETASVLLPHDWLTFRLTGRRVTDRGDSSGTGYWSPLEGRYRFDLLRLIDADKDWESAVPTVLGPSDVVGEWGDRDTLVAPGTGDNMAAALGLGAAVGDVVISLGTSGTAFTVSEVPVADPTGAVAGFADATGRFLPLVCTLNATRVTDAFARLLSVDHAQFDQMALSRDAGAGGVVLVPYLDGERTPNRPDATGTLSGIRSDVSPSQIARAAVEGVVCGMLDAVDALAAVSPSAGTGRLLLVGGGARSSAYRRVLADLSGRQVMVPEAQELVALGAAVQAAAVLHGKSTLAVADAWGLGAAQVVDPDLSIDRAAVRANYAAHSGGKS